MIQNEWLKCSKQANRLVTGDKVIVMYTLFFINSLKFEQKTKRLFIHVP